MIRRWRNLPATGASQPRHTNLPVPARRTTIEPTNLVLGYHLHSIWPRASSYLVVIVELGEPRRAGVAAVEYARHRFLCRGARESARPVRPARDFQCRPGPALAKAGVASSPATTSPAC